jgi:hypothetical protein
MILHLLSFLRTIVLMSVWFSSLFLQMQELARYRDQSNPLNDTIHKAGRPRLCSILYTAIAAPTSIGRIRNDFGHSKEK